MGSFISGSYCLSFLKWDSYFCYPQEQKHPSQHPTPPDQTSHSIIVTEVPLHSDEKWMSSRVEFGNTNQFHVHPSKDDPGSHPGQGEERRKRDIETWEEQNPRSDHKIYVSTKSLNNTSSWLHPSHPTQKNLKHW